MRTLPGPAKALFVAIGLAGTGPCQTLTVVIPDSHGSGSEVRTATQSWADHGGGFHCFNMPHWDRLGETPSPTDGRMFVGFQNQYSDFMGCWTWRSFQRRGFVKFDLTPLQNREVVLASLKYEVSKTDTNAPQVFGTSCALSLWVAQIGGKSLETPGDLVLDGMPEGKLRQPLSIDVTYVVRDWVAGRRRNHGFFIDSERDPPRDNNNLCLSQLDWFELDVIVRN